MPAQDPRIEYAQRLAAWKSRAEGLTRQDRQLGHVRGVVVVMGLLAAWFSIDGRWFPPLWLVLPLAAFIVVAILHERNSRRHKVAVRAQQFHEQALRRMDGHWAGHGPQGERFRDPAHPYADDLDLFGRGSLFELICTARTLMGAETLASWMLHPAERAEVLARQGAIEELAPKVGLREEMFLLGDQIEANIDAQRLDVWGKAARAGFFPGARVVLFLVSVAVLLAAAGRLAGLVSSLPLLIAFLAVAALTVVTRVSVGDVLDQLEARARHLALLRAIIERVEREVVETPRLRQVQTALGASGLRASVQIGRLSRLIELLDSDRNQFFALPAWCLLWRPQFALAIGSWRREAGPHLGEWLTAIGDFEALASLAVFRFEHPATVFPEIGEGGREFDSEQLAHPLISEERAVPNDVRLGESPRLLMVSGSNMSGKSTLLRAVGLNAVLAWAGAPVRARRLHISPLVVASSLRTVDSLQEGRSRFYAEIQGLRRIVEITEGDRPVLFLLDELLSGTNSHDRRIAAEAILRGLLARGAIGLATTHDLALVRIVDQVPGQAINVHFEDEVAGGELRFDYRLRPGVVERSNALDLMRSIGLDV